MIANNDKDGGMQRRRKTTLGMLVVLGAMWAMPLQASDSVKEVEAVMRGLQTDWNAGDMTAYMAAYVENADLRLLSSAGILKGWNTVNTLFREQFPDEPRMGDFTMDDLEVRMLTDNVAVASGNFEHVFADHTIRGSFSHVLRRQKDGRWLIELEHVSRTNNRD